MNLYAVGSVRNPNHYVTFLDDPSAYIYTTNLRLARTWQFQWQAEEWIAKATAALRDPPKMTVRSLKLIPEQQYNRLRFYRAALFGSVLGAVFKTLVLWWV